MKKILTAFILLMFIKAHAQQHNFSDKYVVPSDTLVQQKLAHWQDIKFGLLMHWGTYSEWGIVESWSICPEDEGWTQRRGPYAANYFDYVKPMKIYRLLLTQQSLILINGLLPLKMQE